MWISTDNCFVLDNHRVFYRIENMLGWSFYQQLFLWILLIFWKDEVRTKIIIFWRQHYYLLDIIKQVLILCRLWQFSYIFPILCEVSSFDYHNILLLMTCVIPKTSSLLELGLLLIETHSYSVGGVNRASFYNKPI